MLNNRSIGMLAGMVMLATLATASNADVIFSDNFDSGASSPWSNLSGNWKASGGVYFAQQPNNSPFTYSGLPYDLSSFSVDVDVRHLGDGGIWLRTDGTTSNGVLLVVGGLGYGQGQRGGNAGTAIYWHVVSGGSVSNSMGETDGVFMPGNDYHLRVDVSGNTYRAFVNGTLKTTLTNSLFANGKVGLYDDQPNTSSGGGFGPAQTFDNFALSTSAPLPNPAMGLACCGVALVLWRSVRRRFDDGATARD